uniref:Beta-catenin-like protein 1 n=1 Tax=Heterorhabditis bacteriophora TaxID=37862 RepID=A0A1I7W6I2_HETBA
MASIDVTEILKASSAGYQPAAKRPRPSSNENNVVNTPSTNPQDILAALEDESAQNITIDDVYVKKLLSQLEKKSLKNREMRIKHTDDPKKFMDSEVELDTAIQEMHILATQPDLYGCFVEAGGPSLMLSLLAHENTDLLGATANLLQELTDVEILNEGEEGAAQLIDSLATGRIVETFVTSFEKLDETNKDDADAVHNALSVVENMIDFRPETAEDCVSQGLFHWLLRRACQKGTFDANKMYASELVALLLQMSESAKKKLTEKVDGIDMLLRALAAYKRHDPNSLDEREHMENLFDALCASLMLPTNRAKFLEGEGLQLMNLMLRERKQSRESALKVLDHATTGPEGKDNCNKFVEILGLRTLFPLYMRTPSKVKRKDTTPDEHEEHVCAILSALFRSCGEDARQRMMLKFVEHEHEKIDRAVELFIKYREKVNKFEAKRARNPDSSVDEDVDREYMDKLDAGLYTLQNIGLVIADVCAHTNSARLRAAKLFSMKMKQDKISKVLLPLLTEYQANLGDSAEDERRRIDILISRLTKTDRERD